MERSGSLLIVEDERVLRRCLEIHFLGRGMEVSVAGSVSEARTLLDQSDFDAALLDVGLPDGDGLSLLSELSPERSVVITADPDFERFEAMGVMHVVPKPLDLDIVARVVDGLTTATPAREGMEASTERSQRSLVGRDLPSPTGASHGIVDEVPDGTPDREAAAGWTPSIPRRHARCRLDSNMMSTTSNTRSNVRVEKRMEFPLNEGGENTTPLRIMFYSHDTVGLGHFRRNLVLARALSAIEPRPSILMISGCAETSRFEMPAGVDVLTLPALKKVGRGEYESRSLDVSIEDLIAIRAKAIQAAAQSFGPDLVIVDNVPRGAERELDPTLADLRAESGTHVVLGLRDILDAPEAVTRDWAKSANEEAISAYYDSIWVYGDPVVSDHRIEYGFDASTCEKIEYVGYLDRSESAVPRAATPHRSGIVDRGAPAGPYVLCLVGGGEDGRRLAETFSEIEHRSKLRGLLLLGPFMPADVREKLHRLAAEKPDLSVLDFVVDPIELIRDAECVITMGGYNSVSEVLSFERPTLIVPRIQPRLEQWVRAHKLAKLGLVDVCEPDELSMGRLESWIEKAQDRPIRPNSVIDMGGLRRVREIVVSIGRMRPVAGEERGRRAR